MENLSVVIITKNESLNIERCINSVLWADEIVVLDTGSNDNTIDIAKNLGAKVFSINSWNGFGLAKQEAVSFAKNSWIFSIDADEEVTTDLKLEVQKTLHNPSRKIYKIRRKSFYLGKLIEHSGWNNDYPVRLFDKNYANFNSKKVHESVESSHPIGTIESHLLHFTYNDINSHLKKMILYSDLALDDYPNKQISKFGVIFRGMYKFKQMYFLNLGFLDGKQGFILAMMSAISVMTKYLKFYEKQN